MERSVIVIVPDIDDMYKSSLGTICTFIERGDAAYVLVVEHRAFRTEEERLSLKDQCKRFRISDVFFLDGFDYSCVTQNNADLISTVIQKVKPSIVIMPYWRSANFSRKILARCALIACRGIGTILMYSKDGKNVPKYSPSVFVRVSPTAALIKQQYAGASLILNSSDQERKARTQDDIFLSSVSRGSEVGSALAIDDNNQRRPSHDRIIRNERKKSKSGFISGRHQDVSPDTQPTVEAFESHRMLLVNDETGW
jgi:hypothetical protein